MRNERVVYVGKSLHVERRVSQHMRLGEFDFDDVLFLSGKPEEIDQFERAMIAVYWPRYNVRVDTYSADWLFPMRAQLGFGEPLYESVAALPNILSVEDAEKALGVREGAIARRAFLAPFLAYRRGERWWVLRDSLLDLMMDPNWRSQFS